MRAFFMNAAGPEKLNINFIWPKNEEYLDKSPKTNLTRDHEMILTLTVIRFRIDF